MSAWRLGLPDKHRKVPALRLRVWYAARSYMLKAPEYRLTQEYIYVTLDFTLITSGFGLRWDPGMPSWLFHGLTWLIYISAVFVGLSQVTLGLPYIIWFDEFQVFWNSMFMLQERTPFSNHFFGRGHFLVFVALMVDLPVLIWLGIQDRFSLGDRLTPVLQYEFSVGFEELLVANRVALLLLTASGVWACALIGRLLAGPWAGIAGGLILAVNPFFVSMSSRIEADGPASALAAWSFLYALLAVQRNKRSFVWMSTLFAGLACASKYNFGSVFAASLVAQWMLDTKRKNRRKPEVLGLAKLVGAFGFVVLVTTPSIIRFPIDFVKQMGFQVVMYSTTEGFSEPGFSQIQFQAGQFAQSFGVFGAALAIVGVLALSVRPWLRKYALLLFVGAAPFLLVMVSSRVNYHRNWLFLYPEVAVFVSVGALVIVSLAFVRGKNTFLMNATRGVMFCGLVSIVLLTSFDPSAVARMDSGDTRSQAMAEAWAIVCDSGGDVIADEMLLLNGRDRVPPCAGSQLYEVSAAELQRGVTPGDVVVGCVQPWMSKPSQTFAVRLFVSDDKGSSQCLDVLKPLWNNPPVRNPPVAVVG